MNYSIGIDGIDMATFQEYLNQEQEKAGMSFAPAKVEALRKSYEAMNVPVPKTLKPVTPTPTPTPPPTPSPTPTPADLEAQASKKEMEAQKAPVETPVTPLTEEQQYQSDIDAILQKYGVSLSETPTSPITAFSDVYKQIYENLGLTGVKGQYEALTKDYDALQSEKTDKIAEINENPWLTEPVRQARISAINKKYETKESNLLSRLDLTKSMFESGQEEAKFVAQQTLSEKQGAATLEKEALTKAIDIAEKKAEARAKLAAEENAPKTYQSGIVGEYQFYADQEREADRTPLSFDAYQTRDANRKLKASSVGASSAIQEIANAVIDNPSLWNQYTPTLKEKLTPVLNAMGFTAFGKPLSDTANKEITQTESAIEMLENLKTTIQGNLQYIGPISGLQSLNPYSKARQIQADIDRVKQVVGKALEGGVLRKEDEEKYKKILATVTDTPETALYKVNNLITQLQSNLSTYEKQQMLSGRYVAENEQEVMSKVPTVVSSGTSSSGNKFTITKTP